MTCPCSLPPEQLTQRIEEWRRLAPAMLGSERTPAGARLRYRVEPGVAERLLDLLEAERQCCPTVSFTAELTLDVRAPEELRSWVAETFAPGAASPTAGDQPEAIEEAVRRHYAAVAEGASRCSPAAACGAGSEIDGLGPGAYAADDLEGLPDRAMAASAGCANPLLVADLAAGETVLDLGSGGGIDVLLSARRVGPTGKVYGLDMTDEMLALARANQAAAEVENVELLKGRIEAVPLPAASVDVVVSNCVIALSTDKAAVFAEMHRVLRAEGRLAIADVVSDVEGRRGTPHDSADWVACAAGAISRDRYRAGLLAAGFTAVSIIDSHQVAEGFSSVIVSAVKTSA